MKTITIEEHFLTNEAVAATAHLRAADPTISFRDPAILSQLLDVGAGRVADMDAAGIDMQVLSLAVCGLEDLESAAATALAGGTNDHLAAAVRARPTRFAAFAALALQEPEKAAGELERCVRKLGFKGALVNGTTNGMFLDHPRFTPVLEAAQSLDVPIYLHPGLPPVPVRNAYYKGLPDHMGDFLSTAGWGWHVETGMHSLRLIVAGVFDRLPKLRIIIGHMGENLPFSIARADSVFSLRASSLKGKVIDYFHEHFYVTTSGYFTLPPFLCALQVAGADRLLFSIDYPFSPNVVGQQFLNSLPINATDTAKISYGNAKRLLKI
jgi:predicted TIM-barrel fold metal-dependent hydrolase